MFIKMTSHLCMAHMAVYTYNDTITAQYTRQSSLILTHTFSMRLSKSTEDKMWDVSETEDTILIWHLQNSFSVLLI